MALTANYYLKLNENRLSEQLKFGAFLNRETLSQTNGNSMIPL